MEQYTPAAVKFLHYPSVSNLVGTEVATKKRKRVVLASRLTDRKNIDTCIRLFALLFPDEYILDIYGDGENSYLSYIKNVIRELGIDNRVNFHGFVTHSIVTIALSEAEWYINVAKNDPSPKAVNEALTLKCKIILSTGVGTYEDLIEAEQVLILSKDKIIENAREKITRFDEIMTINHREIEDHSEFKIEKCTRALEYVSKNI